MKKIILLMMATLFLISVNNLTFATTQNNPNFNSKLPSLGPAFKSDNKANKIAPNDMTMGYTGPDLANQPSIV